MRIEQDVAKAVRDWPNQRNSDRKLALVQNLVRRYERHHPQQVQELKQLLARAIPDYDMVRGKYPSVLN
jgi:hypothetical protein